MMKKLIYTFCIGLLVLGTGCKKFLETTPEDFVTPQTFFTKEADAVAALNAAFDVLTRQYMYAGYYQCRMLAADDVYATLTGLNYPGTLSMSASEPAHIPNRWNNLYAAIQYTNIVLDNLPRIDMDARRKNEIKGEALFFRAFCYYLLADEWGDVPLKLTPTVSPTDVSYVRTPAKVVFEQVVKDMIEAEGLVPTTANPLYGGAGYPAKTTVQGMLARVYLKMAGFPINDVTKYVEAKKWALAVVSSGEHELNKDYTAIFTNYATGAFDKKESLWEVDFNDVVGSTEHGYLGYLDGVWQGAASFGNSVGQVRITRKLYELYGATTSDTRRDWNCAPFYWKAGQVTEDITANKNFFTSSQIYDRFSTKFRLYLVPGPKVVGRSAINFPMLRYADVLLMLAEADNAINNGPTPLAYDLVDKVRARAYGKLMPGATNLTEANIPRTQNDITFLQIIQDERARELAAEGLRRHDLIRWGIYVSTIRELKDDVENTSKPAVSSSLKLQMQKFGDRVMDRDVLWPIPASELTFNKEAVQNPGW